MSKTDKEKLEGKPSAQLVLFDQASVGLPANLAQSLADESRDNLEGVTPTLPKIQMPTGKGKEFTIQRQGEEEIQSREVVGILMYQSAANAFWEKPFGQGDSVVPDCASHDGVAPSMQYESVQSSTCASCRHNRFGSAKNPAGEKMPGKACRNVKRLVILRNDGDAIPNLLVVPPSSVRKFDEYMVFLRKQKRPYWTVGTKLTIATQANKSGIDYPEIQFNCVGFVNDLAMLEDLQQKKNEWQELIRSTMFVSTDVVAETGGTAPSAEADAGKVSDEF